MFERIGALAVYVTDLERAKRFYSDILGFEISAELSPSLCFLKSRSGNINISMEGGKHRASVDSQTCRLSFFLRAEETAHKTFVSLKAAGVKILQESPEQVDNDTACFQFEDPDGNIIEVCGKT